MIMIVGPSEYGYIFEFHGSLFATSGVLSTWPDELILTYRGARYLNDSLSEFFYGQVFQPQATGMLRIPHTELTVFSGSHGFCVAPLYPDDLTGQANRRRLRRLVSARRVLELLRDLAWTRICRDLVLHGVPKIQRNIEAECRALEVEGVRSRRISTIRNAASQLRSTISAGDILDPRWEVGPGNNPQQIYKQFERQFAILEATMRSKNIQVDIERCYDKLVMADSDIDAILSNLTSNAVKYARPSSTIRVSFGRDAAFFRIFITGESIAISSEELSRLTRLGYRGMLARRVVDVSEGESYGLGLGIIAKVCHAYGGDLEIQPGRIGSEGYATNSFSVKFPLHIFRVGQAP